MCGIESGGNRTVVLLHACLFPILILKIVTGSLFIEFHIHRATYSCGPYFNEAIVCIYVHKYVHVGCCVMLMMKLFLFEAPMIEV